VKMMRPAGPAGFASLTGTVEGDNDLSCLGLQLSTAAVAFVNQLTADSSPGRSPAAAESTAEMYSSQSDPERALSTPSSPVTSAETFTRLPQFAGTRWA
jgi:hypothetical protein